MLLECKGEVESENLSTWEGRCCECDFQYPVYFGRWRWLIPLIDKDGGDCRKLFAS